MYPFFFYYYQQWKLLCVISVLCHGVLRCPLFWDIMQHWFNILEERKYQLEILSGILAGSEEVGLKAAKCWRLKKPVNENVYSLNLEYIDLLAKDWMPLLSMWQYIFMQQSQTQTRWGNPILTPHAKQPYFLNICTFQSKRHKYNWLQNIYPQQKRTTMQFSVKCPKKFPFALTGGHGLQRQ
jgi:hypothetical protein